MVGRLVQHEEVRWIIEHPRHAQPRLLAAGKHATALVDIHAGKAETARERAQRALRRMRKRAFQRLEHGFVAVEQFHGVLGEIAHLHARADRDRAVIGVGSAGDQLQQGRFSGPVHAQNAPALLAADAEIEPLINDALP